MPEIRCQMSDEKMVWKSVVRIISKGYDGLKWFMKELKCELDLEGITTLAKGENLHSAWRSEGRPL